MLMTQRAAIQPLEYNEALPSEVVVIHTRLSATREAMRDAQSMAAGLGMRLRLLSAEVVPYPLPLHAPPVHIAFTEERLRELTLDVDIETCVDVRLGRDRWETLLRALPGTPAIVLGGRLRWWWPTAEARLARKLRRHGYQVIFANLP